MKSPELKVFVFSFIVISVLMSLFSEQVSSFASKLLSMSGELKLYTETDPTEKENKDNYISSQKIKKTPKEEKNKPNDKTQINLLKQIVDTNLPKTPKPIAYLLPDNNFASYKIPPFPEMRLYTGETWTKEKTEIYCATDGYTLYLKAVCHDSNPDMLVKEFSLAGGSVAAWKDDSVEVFLMKDHLSDNYYQFVASSSGKSHRYNFKINPDDPRIGFPIRNESADDFVSVTENEQGYVAEFEIPLTEINFNQNLLKEGFHMQVVRNYRGEKTSFGAVSLQLFPVYIYGDNRFGECNHYWKAFGQITVKEYKNE